MAAVSRRRDDSHSSTSSKKNLPFQQSPSQPLRKLYSLPGGGVSSRAINPWCSRWGRITAHLAVVYPAAPAISVASTFAELPRRTTQQLATAAATTQKPTSPLSDACAHLSSGMKALSRHLASRPCWDYLRNETRRHESSNQRIFPTKKGPGANVINCHLPGARPIIWATWSMLHDGIGCRICVQLTCAVGVLHGNAITPAYVSPLRKEKLINSLLLHKTLVITVSHLQGCLAAYEECLLSIVFFCVLLQTNTASNGSGHESRYYLYLVPAWFS